MGAPGVKVSSRATRPRRGVPTDTGVAFCVDFMEWGPHEVAVEVNSHDEFKSTFGGRVGHSLASDAVEAAFAEGLAQCFIARQVGPDPVKASLILKDRSAGAGVNTARIDAIYVGDRGNEITIEIEDGAVADTFSIVVSFDGDVVERFSDLPTPAAAVAAVAESDYVRGANLGSVTAAPNNNPRVLADTALAGGTDDHASSTNAEFVAALALFKKDLGPGQVFAPGRTTLAQRSALIAHCVEMNHTRTAALDAPDLASRATMLTDGAALRPIAGSSDAAYLGNWWDIPGVDGGPTRAVPGSAIWVGATARTDALEGTAGAGAAGEVSTASYALAVREPAGGFSEADYAELNDAGIIMSRNFRHRGPQIFGVRAITDDPDWEQITSHRLRMSLTARLEAVAFPFPFKRLDAHGHLLGEYNGALASVCKEEWQKDALYGETSEEAYSVDTGPTVNTPATAADKQIHARVGAKFSPTAEQVFIDLVKEPLP